MTLDVPTAGEQEQRLLQRCNTVGLGHWVFAVQEIVDRLRGIEDYIDNAADCPLPAVAQVVDEAASCDPGGRDTWLVSRLARLRCFHFHASCARQRWNPTAESFRIFASRGEVQVWEDVLPNPGRGQIEVWLRRMRTAHSANDAT